MSAAAPAASVGADIRAAGPSQGANRAPLGAAPRRQPQAWGQTFALPGRPKARIAPPWGAAPRRQPQAWGQTSDSRGSADGTHRVRQVGARNGPRGALPGRDRERGFRAGLSRDGHRYGETRRGGASAGAASSRRHHRSGRRLLGGAFLRRCDACDRRDPIARCHSAARRRDDALLQGAAGGAFGVAGRRSGRACATGRPCRGGRLARVACRARASRSGDGRAPQEHGCATHPARAGGV